jgi:bifunctional NMN adenylyltransferase/nudix hydrolase
MLVEALKRSEATLLSTVITIAPLNDYTYSDTGWEVEVQTIVSLNTHPSDRIGIIGSKKDSSSFYLSKFPQWDLIEVPITEQLSSTDIRILYFQRNPNLNFLTGVMPSSVVNWLKKFSTTKEFADLVDARELNVKYRTPYSALPYEVIFVTADAVVIQSGHILLVKRRANPGRGLLALPGGFVNASSDRTVEDAAIRELYEETCIKVPEKIVRGSITQSRVFDAPGRSERGRTITHAILVELSEPGGVLPKVKGSDDAISAKWYPISSLTSENMFDDHYDIIFSMLGVQPTKPVPKQFRGDLSSDVQ